MKYTLGKNIETGNKIKTDLGWRKVTQVTTEGAMVKEGLIPFKTEIFGWKIK